MSEDLLRDLAGLAAATRSQVYVVGGYLRDRLLGREPVDLDLLVEGNPAPFLDALSRRAGFHPVIFARREPITYRVAMGDWLIDVSSCPAGGLKEAMERRDFTINALAAPLVAPGLEAPGGRLSPIDAPIDLMGGLEDMRAHRIHHIAPERLDEDPVRLLRAVRLAVLLDGFTLDAGLRDEIRRRAPRIASAPSERILPELEMVLASDRAGAGLRMMKEVGLLFPLFPALQTLDGLQQNAWHRHDVLEHTFRTVEELDRLAAGLAEAGVHEPLTLEETERVKWAALFHDTGKAGTVTTDGAGQVHFYGHEVLSVEIAHDALEDLRMAGRKIDRIMPLIAHHLRLPILSAAGGVSEKALRRLVHQVKHETPLLCLLAVADRRSGGGPGLEAQLARLSSLCARVMAVLTSEGERVISPPPLQSGDEVMEALGLPPGPRVGLVLRWLTRLQVEGRISRKDQAVEAIHALPASRLLTLEEE